MPTSGSTATSYVLEAGVAPGDASLAASDTGSSATSLTVATVPTGTYFVRVKARNSAGISAASNEIVVVVGGSAGPCSGPPSAPAALTATVSGQTVTLNWTAAAGIVTTYVLEAGSISGASNLVNAATGSTSTSLTAVAPPGIYFVRVKARNPCGTSTAIVEVVVTVF